MSRIVNEQEKSRDKLPQKVARIKDVARAAGVSTATVSRALSSPDVVSEKTREVVRAAVHETGYRVNQAARNLRKQRAGAVLVLVPNLGNPFFSQILSGISQGISDSEYSVLIMDTNHLPTDHNGLIDYFLDSRIDAMISLDGSLSPDVLDSFDATGVADRIICACEWIAGRDMPSVRSDNAKGARLAIQHLYDLGHRKIAHITGPAENVLTHVRKDAAVQMRSQLGLEARPEWIIRGDFSLMSGQDASRRFLEMPEEDRPTAVFCASDEVALGLISGLLAAGVDVPGDVSVVGFDDIEVAEHFVPALTTIRQERTEIGLAAANLLLERLAHHGQQDEPGLKLIDVTLQVRASTAPPRSAGS